VSQQIRAIARTIIPTGVLEGAGVRLRRSIATRELDYVDPFLLFDDFSSANPDDYVRGFPWHPHRGIETVTYILSGVVAHRDSLGNAGRIGAGDVQWMTSGSGIMHEEMPRPGDEPLIGFQLWVNLPARRKMMTPRYQDIPAKQIPLVAEADGARVRIIAGEYGGQTGPVRDIAADPTYLDLRLPPEGTIDLSTPTGAAAFAYLFEGATRFGPSDQTGGAGELPAPHLVIFGDGDAVRARAGAEGSRFLLISGAPLGEPIARHGPFVMNTREEIREALHDLDQGTFIRAQPESGGR
jgi:redox-sensitive bicupin YhaK (pirin superfamily)